MTRALKISVVALIFAVAGVLASTPAEALLDKHECFFCHSLHGGTPTPGGSTDFVPENSATNIEVLCLGCHVNAIDGSQPPYNSDTDTDIAAPVQPHKTDDGSGRPEFHISCNECHEVHDNMPNWLGSHAVHADGSTNPALIGGELDGWVEGTNEKMVGREDPDGETPYAMVITKERDDDRDGVRDFGNPAIVQDCIETLVNDCFMTGKRHIVFENFDPETFGGTLHAYADHNEDGLIDASAIGMAANVSQKQLADVADGAVSGPSGDTYNLLSPGGLLPALPVDRYIIISGFADPGNNGVFLVTAENVGNEDYTVQREDGGTVGAAESGVAITVDEKPISQWDSLCQGCHTQTNNHSLATGSTADLTHNQGRRCTFCHEHQQCFDNNGTCSTAQHNDTRDLQVDGVTVPAPVFVDNSVTISVDVSNLGTRREAFDVRYFSDIEGFLGRSRVEAAAGASLLLTTLDWVPATVGVHEIKAEIYPVIFETVIDNNYDIATVSVTPPVFHDVAVTSVSAPGVIGQGSTVTVDIDVANPGTFAETFDVTLVSDNATPGNPGDDITLETWTGGTAVALGAGGSTTLNFNWDTTGATLGLHTLTATAAHDDGDGGTDINAGNDSADTTSEVKVPTHDVAVDQVTAPDPTLQGNTVTVSVDVSNQGTFDETFNVELFDDTEGGTVAVPIQSSGLLGPGETTTLNYDWTPTTLSTHSLRAVAATVTGETNTANNTQTTTAKVVAVPVIADHVESNNGGSGTSTTVNTTPTRPAGDVYIVVGTKDDDDAWVLPTPPDWGTPVYDVGMGAAARHTVWAFVGPDPVPASYTIDHDNEGTEFTFMHLTGADAVDIVDDGCEFGAPTASGTANPATAPAVTPDNGFTLVIRTFGADNDQFVGGSSEGTTIVNVGGGGNADVSLLVSHTDGPAGGVSTGTATATLAADDEWAAGTLCINPQ
jgi:hypothetical protein